MKKLNGHRVFAQTDTAELMRPGRAALLIVMDMSRGAKRNGCRLRDELSRQLSQQVLAQFIHKKTEGFSGILPFLSGLAAPKEKLM
jgi:hypothetical protein